MATPVKPGSTPSLPGAMSTRTDGGPASKQAIRYAAGEPGAEDFTNLQGQAAMSKTPDVKGMAPSQIRAAAEQGAQPNKQQAAPMANAPQPIPLGAPSQFPEQPVTHGASSGPGAGPESLILPDQTAGQYQSALQMFQQMAANPNASAALKYLAQRAGQAF